MANDLIIGIPVHNDVNNLQACIKSIFESTVYPFKIVVVESGSTDGTAEWLDFMVSRYKNFEVIHTKKEGPLRAYNRLFQLAKERKCDLYLTQADVNHFRYMGIDWLWAMSKASEHDDCGIVTCVNGGGVSGPELVEDFKWVGGWCAYVPLRTIELIGGYDENYEMGDMVDIDYTYNLKKQGLKTYVLPFWVDHHRLGEHQDDGQIELEEVKERNRRYFKRKWGLS